ncbi:hypothetical protein QTJ16_000855 [Diplocarpon rosae]|uniref:Extracellular metalloproteinase n=1 Tax=Diplocarpon rosae TaxID=946125 RepID=A0AAD9T7T6_9HELO|nr:hypothetical protein QTJ16_000855 [Diplocarpon rosae]
MRLLSKASAVALLASNVLGDPTTVRLPKGTGAVQSKPIDFSDYLLKTETTYTREEIIENSEVGSVAKRATYVDTATAFLRAKHPGALYRVANDHYVGANGVAHVYFKQVHNGLDVDNSDFNVNIAPSGHVFSAGSSFQPRATTSEPKFELPPMNVVNVLDILDNRLNFGLNLKHAVAKQDGHPKLKRFIIHGVVGSTSKPKARLVYFQKPDTTVVRAWRLEIHVDMNWCLLYIEASEGLDILAVVDYVSHATYNVFPWGTNDPSKGSRVIETDPQNHFASTLGWLRGYPPEAKGNNAITVKDWKDENGWPRTFSPNGGPNLDFNFPLDLSSADPDSYVSASATQLFYTVNRYHDLLYLLGFHEAAGNFQDENFGQGGLGGDAVVLHAQDSAGANGASFIAPADGERPHMYMYIWNQTDPSRDSSFDAGIVIHEYTHGLSKRLVGGPENSACLSTEEGRGLSEGWSDFMAIATQVKQTHTRAQDFVFGDWVSGNKAGLRSYPYSTNKNTNPLTYIHANSNKESHFLGSIWATMLNEVLWNLIKKHGISNNPLPEFHHNGVPTDGKFLAMKLVVDSMALLPCNPNFRQARNAILEADLILTGGDNTCLLWDAFAKRGLGDGADSSPWGRAQSWKIPPECAYAYSGWLMT